MSNINKHIVLNSCLLTFVFVCLSFFSMAQLSQEQAAALFNKGKYSEVVEQYADLYRLYPNTPEIAYRYAVCLTETDQKGDFARKIFLKAMQHELPNDANFYLAKNYHALNNFEKALEFYHRFGDEAKKKVKKKLGFQTLIEAAQNNENPFSVVSELLFIQNVAYTETNSDTITNHKQNDFESATIALVIEDTEVKTDSVSEVETTNDLVIENEQNDNDLIIPEELKDELISFIVTAKILYRSVSQFETIEGLHHFVEGWENMHQLEQALIEMKALRLRYDQSNLSSTKEEIANKLLQLEPESLQLKANADALFLKAREAEVQYWNSASAEQIEALNAENQKLQQNAAQTLLDETGLLENEPEIESTDEDAILDDERIELEEVPVVTEPADKVVYKVQIGAYSKGLPDYVDRLYKRLSVLRRIDQYTSEKGVVVYTVGELSRFDDAVKLQNQIRQEGVSDAFVVAFLNGKRIALNEAQKISE